MANLIARIDESENSLYYKYLEENKAKDANTITSGISSKDTEEDYDAFDLFDKIKDINNNSEENLYKPDADTSIEDTINSQLDREEELIRKKNEEQYEKEQQEKLLRQQQEEIEALKEQINSKEKKSFNPFSKIKDKIPFDKLPFVKKDDNDEFDEFLKQKEEEKKKEEESKNENKAESKPVAKEEKSEKVDKPSIFKKKEKEEKDTTDWKYLALHDEVTGLLNKKAFNSIDKSALGKYSIIYADINSLKYTNDNLGHDLGDKLIKNVGNVLNTLFPEQAYRIGGDEFVVVLDTDDSVSLGNKVNAIDIQLRLLSSKDFDITYSMATGSAIGTGKEFNDAVREAEEGMYSDKHKYKELHPEIYGKVEPEPEKPKTPENYNTMLSKEQQILKNEIADNHTPINQDKVDDIIARLRESACSIECIFITDPTFNKLFIFTDINVFIEMADDSLKDFSYLYALYENGPQYIGMDPYNSEVTHIFENVGKALMEGKIKSIEDVTKIRDINIFQEIYADFV